MWLYIAFLVLIMFLLALDLGVFHQKSHTVSTKEAVGWTVTWVSLSLLFSIFVYFAYENEWVAGNLSGKKAVINYLTGYLVEQSLSLDNIFVIALIFSYFQVPPKYQHRVLFWGILGALVFRGVMIGLGVVLINRFSWLMYVFGVFLLYSAYKMLTTGDSVHPNQNPVIKMVRRVFPVVDEYDGDHFFVKRNNVTAATPLFIALVMVETTDIMFAFDSIPAIFAITTDPFIVFTSNIFAILGLRSLYFVLASMLGRFAYLKYSLVLILVFVAFKMLSHHYIEMPDWVSLVFILVALLSGIFVSLYLSRKEVKQENALRKAAHSEEEQAR